MPSMITLGAASARGFGLFGAKAGIGGPYWIGQLSSAADEEGWGCAVSGSGNLYICGRSRETGNYYLQLAKYNNSGVLQWQKQVDATQSVAYSVWVDASENVYACGYSEPSGALSVIIKFNSSGGIQWQRTFSNSIDRFRAVRSDSSGNVYIAGAGYDVTSRKFLIVKLDSGGATQWQRLFGGTNNDVAYGIDLDAAGNVYGFGTSYESGTADFQLVKYNNSGVIQWQRKLSSNQGAGRDNDEGYAVAASSSGNVYVCGESNADNQDDFQIAKYDTSGTIQWQRRLGTSGQSQAYSIALDSLENVYVTGWATAPTPGNENCQIVKYNTSGVIQWQRVLRSSAGDRPQAIAIDISGNIYVAGNAAGDFLFAKLPGDGSLTGTYTLGGRSYIYEASTLTDAVSTLVASTTTLSDAASTFTNSVSSFSVLNSGLTSSVTTI